MLANADAGTETPVQRPMCIFGAKSNNAPVLGRPKWEDLNAQGKTEKRGIHTWQVGTVAAKHWLFRRMGADADLEREDRLVHFSDQLEREFFTGMVSETYDPKTNRFVKKRGARNEPLDTYVYAYAAAHHPELHLHRFKVADWAAAEARIAASAPAQPVAVDAGNRPETASLPVKKPEVPPAAPKPQRARVSRSTYLR